MKRIVFTFVGLFLVLMSQAVSPNSLFSDHMVLQQGVKVPVWGLGRDGEKIKVEFEGQTQNTVVKNGKWFVTLKPLKSGGAFSMTISGDNVVKINDVYVGEVWVCSGQSNMERQLGLRHGQKPIFDWEKERDAANYPQIRMYIVPRANPTDSLITDIKSKWDVCSPETVINFSAVGYFFGRDLYNKIKTPIGLLFTAVGGTPAEFWTSRAKLEKNPDLLPLVQAYDKALKEYPTRLADYQKKEPDLLVKFKADSIAAAKDNKPLPKRPTPPANPEKGRHIATLYNAMISPLIPYAIKGVIWYQGEANDKHAKTYQTLLPAMIEDWRERWQVGEFPFLMVQIAPYKDMSPEIRESQLLIWKKTKNTGMVVTTDVGDSADIHPIHKQEVGFRLALQARALAYKEKIEYSGAVYKSYKVVGNKIEIEFDHAQNGLVSKDGDLKGFVIAGKDKNFVEAKAQIQGNKVIVYSDAIKEPVAVRYGWAKVPHVNLYNKEDLPASPFRTDVE